MSICFDRRIPSLLEYFGYMFHHSTLLAGPVCTFNDFMDFIEGRDIASATDQVRRKILATVHRFLFLTKLLYRGNLSHNLDILLYYEDFIQWRIQILSWGGGGAVFCRLSCHFLSFCNSFFFFLPNDVSLSLDPPLRFKLSIEIHKVSTAILLRTCRY